LGARRRFSSAAPSWRGNCSDSHHGAGGIDEGDIAHRQRYSVIVLHDRWPSRNLKYGIAVVDAVGSEHRFASARNGEYCYWYPMH
jgi:hypothetical protein